MEEGRATVAPSTLDPREETFGIGELSRRTGVPAPTIRTWQARGLLLGRRTLGGHRRFTQADVDRIKRFVYLVRDADHTIAGAIAKLCTPNGARRASQGGAMVVTREPLPRPAASPRLRLTGLFDAVQALIEMAAAQRRQASRTRRDTVAAQLATVAQKTVTALRGDLAVFLLLERGALRPFTSSGAAGALPRQSFPYEPVPIHLGRALERGEPVRLTESDLSRGWLQALGSPVRARSAVAAPMEQGGRLLGVSIVFSRELDGIAPDAGELLMTVGSAVASAALIDRPGPVVRDEARPA